MGIQQNTMHTFKVDSIQSVFAEGSGPYLYYSGETFYII